MAFDSLTQFNAPDGAMTLSPVCFDGVQNQDETGVDCGGACPACGGGGSSCAEILASAPTSVSGVYQLDNDGSGPEAPYFAYCEMVEDGGGWTLALKSDGQRTTFRYGNEELWLQTNLLNPNLPDLDDNEAKLKSYNVQPFTQLRIGLKLQGVTRWLIISDSAIAANSLYDLLNEGRTLTNVAKSEWLSLIPGASLQANCNMQGIRVADSSGALYARIGIITNSVNDCVNTNAVLGIGLGGSLNACRTMSAGNCDDVDAGANLTTMGYVMVR